MEGVDTEGHSHILTTGGEADAIIFLVAALLRCLPAMNSCKRNSTAETQSSFSPWL